MTPVHGTGPPAWVEMVRAAVAAPVPVMLTGVVLPKFRVGEATAFAGLDVSVAVSATLPVNPSAEVTVMAETFPVVAPAASVTDVPLMVKPGPTVDVARAQGEHAQKTIVETTEM